MIRKFLQSAFSVFRPSSKSPRPKHRKSRRLVIETLEGRTLLSYAITDLSTLGGSGSTANGINNAGQVVGNSYTSSGIEHPFLYQNGSMIDLGTLSGSGSTANGINNAGQVVGTYTKSGIEHPFLYQNGGMIDLNPLDTSGSTAAGINNAGQVVGSAYLGPYSHAALYQNGNPTNLDAKGYYTSSYATGINDEGQVVGVSNETGIGYNTDYAVLFQNGDSTRLASNGPIYAYYGAAYGINNAGQVVGSFNTNGSDNISDGQAFLYQNGHATFLGTLGGQNSAAYGINNAGQVVGYSDMGGGGEHAFLYQNGSMTDLNRLVAGSGWTLSSATAINDNGQIVGNGVNPVGQSHAYLLTPTNDVVTTLADSGPGSLRDVITNVNKSFGGTDPITFANNIQGGTISPQSPLPQLTRSQVSITGPIVLNGASVTGDGLDVAGNMDSVTNVTALSENFLERPA